MCDKTSRSPARPTSESRVGYHQKTIVKEERWRERREWEGEEVFKPSASPETKHETDTRVQEAHFLFLIMCEFGINILPAVP